MRNGGSLIVRLAYLYVRLLVGLEVLLASLSVTLNVAMLLGAERLYAHYGKVLFFSAFGMMLPVPFLAKEKNIWKNEFALCPQWLRVVAVAFIVYGAAAAFYVAAFSVDGPAIESSALSGSALPLAFEALALCILYPVSRSGSVHADELIRRVRNSSIALAVGAAYLLGRNYLPIP